MAGTYAAPEGPALCVAVTARAVDGKATQAVLKAVAEAFGLRPREVRLVSGTTSRSKVVELDGDTAILTERLNQLLEA